MPDECQLPRNCYCFLRNCPSLRIPNILLISRTECSLPTEGPQSPILEFRFLFYAASLRCANLPSLPYKFTCSFLQVRTSSVNVSALDRLPVGIQISSANFRSSGQPYNREVQYFFAFVMHTLHRARNLNFGIPIGRLLHTDSCHEG